MRACAGARSGAYGRSYGCWVLPSRRIPGSRFFERPVLGCCLAQPKADAVAIHRRVRAAVGLSTCAAAYRGSLRTCASAGVGAGREYSLVQGDLRRRVISAPHAVGSILRRPSHGGSLLQQRPCATLQRALACAVCCVATCAAWATLRVRASAGTGPSAGPVPECAAFGFALQSASHCGGTARSCTRVLSPCIATRQEARIPATTARHWAAPGGSAGTDRRRSEAQPNHACLCTKRPHA